MPTPIKQLPLLLPSRVPEVQKQSREQTTQEYYKSKEFTLRKLQQFLDHKGVNTLLVNRTLNFRDKVLISQQVGITLIP